MLCYVWVSEWNSGCGRVAYVVWRPGDFGGPVRVVVCVVCRGWLVGYGDGVRRRELRFLFHVRCGVLGIGLCGVGELIWFGCCFLLSWDEWCVAW